MHCTTPEAQKLCLGVGWWDLLPPAHLRRPLMEEVFLIWSVELVKTPSDLEGGGKYIREMNPLKLSDLIRERLILFFQVK